MGCGDEDPDCYIDNQHGLGFGGFGNSEIAAWIVFKNKPQCQKPSKRVFINV
jgi:hypothetical protein